MNFIYVPYRDEFGKLTVRGVAWELYERGYWNIWQYVDFCDRNGFVVF
jgi:hypothetical protein